MPDAAAVNDAAVYSVSALGGGGALTYLGYRVLNFWWVKVKEPSLLAAIANAKQESDARVKRDQDMPAMIAKMAESIDNLTKLFAATAQLVSGISNQVAKTGAIQKIAVENDRKIAAAAKAGLEVQKKMADMLIRIDDRTRDKTDTTAREDLAGDINYLRGQVAGLGEDSSDFDLPPLPDADAAADVPPSQNPKSLSSARLRTPPPA